MKTDKLETAVGGAGFSLPTPACGLFLAYLVIALTFVAFVPTAYGQTTPAVQLEAAIATEQVDGDLTAAMAAYQKIGAQAAAPRDVRAKALLHLAGCYEKLGKQAGPVYEQIVRDFGDQPTATQARARLAAIKQSDRPAAPVTMSLRKIERTALGDFSSSDTDGHRAVYWDKAAGALIFGDLAGQTRRVISKDKPGEGPGWFPSKDFSMVAILLRNPSRLAIVKTDGAGYREIFNGGPEWPPLVGKAVSNWSWDNRHVVIPGDGTLWVITAADGTRREVVKKNREGGSIEKAAFSPDGRFIAYSTIPSEASKDQTSRILVVPVKVGEPRLVYAEESANYFRLLDWTLDSHYLAVASARSGRNALYLQPVKDGQPAGEPVLIRRGDFDSGYIFSEGSLIFEAGKVGNVTEVHLAALDAGGHPGKWQLLDLRGEHRFNPAPTFSPDGSQISYSASSAGAETPVHNVVYIRDLATGKEREVYRGTGMVYCQWAAQHPKLFCTERTQQKNDLFSVSVASGEIEKLRSTAGFLFMIRVRRDDQALYLVRDDTSTKPPSGIMLSWDIASRQETVLERLPNLDSSNVIAVVPSPDERWLFRIGDAGLAIRPLAGGDWKLLDAHAVGYEPEFTPDGNALLYHGTDAAGQHGLYRISVAGGQPQRLGDYPTTTKIGGVALSRDGLKIMTVSMDWENRNETWVLENFVPAAARR